MSKFLTITAVLLLGAWAIGFFRYDLGLTIHILLLLATLAFIIKVLTEK
ncbi:lmo0937 family membrane protein [Costertonia aggregata]|uniref:Lmo0937 family membrane protein n=1 Tax=Costertonia aggregata TaxID=343403 RepID=A0A7H9ANL1_9FLAO|nr:lmo0937 family membrane protein [Costertonia aggregata]QLG44984.1 lmo0937 family membrane protein [Costertonia aggregata]